MWRLGLCLALCACRFNFDAIDRDAHPSDGTPQSCAMATAVPASGIIGGTLATATGDQHGSCGGDGFAERIYTIDVPANATDLLVAADHDPFPADTLIYVRSSCTDPASEVACDNDDGNSSGAAARFAVPAGRYYVYVDGENDTGGEFGGVVNVLLPQGAACSDATPRDRCAPELVCNPTAHVCDPAGCVIADVLNTGALSYSRTAVTTGALNVHAGSCGQGNDGGVRAPEVVYQLTLPAAVTNVHVSTVSANTDFDTLIYIRGACGGNDVACNDDNGGSMNASDLDTGGLAAGDYYIFIDGFADHAGTADVTVTITP